MSCSVDLLIFDGRPPQKKNVQNRVRKIPGIILILKDLQNKIRSRHGSFRLLKSITQWQPFHQEQPPSVERTKGQHHGGTGPGPNELGVMRRDLTTWESLGKASRNGDIIYEYHYIYLFIYDIYLRWIVMIYGTQGDHITLYNKPCETGWWFHQWGSSAPTVAWQMVQQKTWETKVGKHTRSSTDLFTPHVPTHRMWCNNGQP